MRCAAALLVVASVLLLCAQVLGAPTNMLLNPSFETGRAAPDYWDGFGFGKRQWEFKGVDGERCVSIAGDGKDDGWWYARRWTRVGYNQMYQVSYWVREDTRGALGMVMGGLNLARHWSVPDNQWQREEYFFRSPDYLPRVEFRLWQKGASGVVYFDNVALRPAVAVHRSRGMGQYALGEGESISERRYTATHELLGKGTSDCRFLYRYTAELDHDRWVLDGTRLDEVVYHHEVRRARAADVAPVMKADALSRSYLPVRENEPNVERSVPQDSVSIEVDVARCRGTLGLQVAASPKGPWVQIASAKKPTRIKAQVPQHMLPRRDIWVRLKSLSGRRSEVTGYRYSSLLQQAEWHAPVTGETTYLTVLEQAPDVSFAVVDAGEMTPGGRGAKLLVGNDGARRQFVVAALVRKGDELVSRQEQVFWLAKGSVRLADLPYSVADGEQVLEIVCRDEETGEVLLSLESRFTPKAVQGSREQGDREPVERLPYGLRAGAVQPCGHRAERCAALTWV